MNSTYLDGHSEMFRGLSNDQLREKLAAVDTDQVETLEVWREDPQKPGYAFAGNRHDRRKRLAEMEPTKGPDRTKPNKKRPKRSGRK